MKNVFITGASGFIGKKLTEKLVAEGFSVTALILPGESSLLAGSGVLDIIEGNLTDINTIIKKTGGRKFDTLYNLAWIGVSTAQKNNASVQIKNIEVSINAFLLAQKLNCERIISTGSVSEYAYVKERVNGYQLPGAADLYSATKASVHIYYDFLSRQYNILYNRVLLPSIYGPGRDDSNLISYTIKSLLSGQTPLFTKLEQLWDYLYIDDAITALMLVGQYGRSNKTYVAGTGAAVPLYDYVKIIRDKIDRAAKLDIGKIPYKTIAIDNSIVDLTEIATDTGFFAKTNFEEGITRTIDWYKSSCLNKD